MDSKDYGETMDSMAKARDLRIKELEKRNGTLLKGMFTGFWVIGSDFFQSDPNINSDPISFNRTR